MKNLWIVVFFFIATAATGLAQNAAVTVSDTRQQEQQLLNELAGSKPTINHIERLIQLSAAYLFKPGEETEDLDKAALYASKASKLSTALKYIKGNNTALYYLAIINAERGDLETAKTYLPFVDEDTRIVILNYISVYYLYRRQYPGIKDSSILYFHRTLAAYKKRGIIGSPDDQQTENRAINGLYMLVLDDKEKIKQLTVLAEAIIHKREAAGALCNSNYLYYYLSSRYYDLEDYKTALSYTHKIIACDKKNRDDSVLIAESYRQMGQIYKTINEPENALKNNLLATNLLKKIKNVPPFFSYVEAVSTNYLELNRTEEALQFILSTIKETPPKETGDQFLVYKCLGECYSSANQPALAKEYFDKMMALPKNDFNLIVGSSAFGTFYFKQGKYELARPLILQAIAPSPIFRTDRYYSNAYQKLYKIDSALGNYISAMDYLCKYKSLSDAYFNKDRIRQVHEMEIQYETVKKDNEIKLKARDILLLTRQTELQQQTMEQAQMQFQFETREKEQTLQLINAEVDKKDKNLQLNQQSIALLKNEALLKQASLQKANLISNVTFAGIILSLIIMVLLYTQYRNKQKANKEINKKNETLQHLVDEKQWLLKEIHHRVKNNLQTVVSLLESQSAYLQSDALQAIQDSQNRVHAMSLVHQKLYHTESVACINMATYLPELVHYLKDSFNAKKIHFTVTVADINLDISQAIPIGLIVNEAITNAIKYAFTGTAGNNQAHISMYCKGDTTVLLTIADNGLGLPFGFNSGQSKGLGLKLMKGLTEDINGQFSIQSQNGTTISVLFTANAPLNKTNAANNGIIT